MNARIPTAAERWAAMSLEDRIAMAVAAPLYLSPWKRAPTGWKDKRAGAPIDYTYVQMQWVRESREGGIWGAVGTDAKGAFWWLDYGVWPHSACATGDAATVAEAMLTVDDVFRRLKTETAGVCREKHDVLPDFEIFGGLPTEVACTDEDRARVDPKAVYNGECGRIRGDGGHGRLPTPDDASLARWAAMTPDERLAMAEAAPIVVGAWRRTPPDWAQSPMPDPHRWTFSRETREDHFEGSVTAVRGGWLWRAVYGIGPIGHGYARPFAMHSGECSTALEAMARVDETFAEMKRGRLNGDEIAPLTDFELVGGVPTEVPA
ncbi:MAG: hypothetical protein ACHREM_00290 [Polyangiales bacterium]